MIKYEVRLSTVGGQLEFRKCLVTEKELSDLVIGLDRSKWKISMVTCYQEPVYSDWRTCLSSNDNLEQGIVDVVKTKVKKRSK